MSELAADRDFQSFKLGDDPLRLSDGVIPAIVESIPGLSEQIRIPRYDPKQAKEVELDWRNSPEIRDEIDQQLRALVGIVGKGKVLKENREIAIHPGLLAGLVAASGIQLELNRSLWTPDKIISGTEDLTVITGGVGPWIDRVSGLLESRAEKGSIPERLSLQFGSRIMDSASDQRSENVREFYDRYGRFPAEWELAEAYLIDQYRIFGYEVNADFYPDTDSGDEIARRFFAANKELLQPGKKVVFARVANAGLQLAIQFLKAGRQLNPAYDLNPANPQIYVLTDPMDLAMNRRQIASPDSYQSPYTAARQLMLTARLLGQVAEIRS